MSYTLRLACGCSVYVSCHPRTRLAHTRVLETRSARCPDRRHEVGRRLWLWELLPAEGADVQITWSEAQESPAPPAFRS